ncbi:unnamed protein product [Paramecium octaurelia]|uniref:Transmembrane protein n=1 Tax=Paramecium octaurelia TaxID=43137 RepID=A0A8S1W0Q6_PAROT|nr:unnamed protein product [Paramecium octaurelia]
MFEQHFILLSAILIGLYLRQVQSECEKRRLASHDIFFAKNDNSALIESDSQERFNFVENQIQSSFLILIQENEKIISTQFIESPNDNLEAEKWLCQLIYTLNQYYISCTVSIYIDEEGNTYQKHEEDYFRLKIETSQNEKCYQFYLEKNLEFIVFCNDQQILNIYSVNLLNEFKVELQYDNIFYREVNCLHQSHKVDFGYYIISYFQCINWKLLKYQDKQISILADSLILQQKGLVDIVQDDQNQIYFCGQQVVLTEDDSAYIFMLEESLNFFQTAKYLGYKILNVLFSKSCSIEYYTLIAKIDNLKQLYIKQLEDKQSIDQQALQTYFAFNYLFILRYDKLEIILLENKGFEIIFYIIDEYNKLISFYYIKKLDNYLLPTKSYIHEIPNSYSITYTPQCYEIIQEIDQSKLQTISYEFKNECQSNEQIIIQIIDYNFPIYQEFANQGEFENVLKYIIENAYLKDFCPNIEQYLEEFDLLFYHPKTLENYAILNSNDTLQILYCTNQTTIQKDVRNYKVIQFQESILLIKQKEQSAKIIYYSIGVNQQNEIQIQSQIKQILQFKQYVILVTENQADFLFLDLSNNKQKKITKKLKQILNYFNNEENQNKQIKFFFAQFHYFQLYQINKQLVIDKYQEINIYEIKDITIIYSGESKRISNFQIIPNKYFVIGIHNQYSIIKQYILDDSLKFLENYQIDGYDFIRPIKFQNSKEYLAVALNQFDQNYLFIFSIEQPIQLIKILKISKLNFHLQNHLVYYYNKDEEYQIFDIKYFKISYLNLAENQQQIVWQEKIPLLFKHQEEEISPNQLFLDIQVNNYCRKLNSKKTEIVIQVQDEEIIRIEDIDMFQGPIDKLMLMNNLKLQLVGPFLQQQQIEECVELEQICIRKMGLVQPWNKDEQALFYSLKYYNKYKVLPFYYNRKLENGEIIIKDAYIFRNTYVLCFYEIRKLVYANILQFNKTQLYQQFQPMQLKEFKNGDLEYAQFYQSNNLLLIKSNSSQLLLKITQNKISEIEKNFDLYNMLLIGNSNDQYIEIRIIKKISECYFLFTVFQLFSFNLQIQDSYRIYSDQIISALSPHIRIYIYQFDEYFKNQLLEAVLVENQIEIKVLQLTLSFSVISKITINLDSPDNISYDVQKIMRHPSSQELLTFQYYDSNTLILSNSISKNSYLYDLRQQKQFYDYIFKMDDNMLKLYPLNTTHFLFYFNEINQFKIGQIGFEIQRLQELDDVETCTIKALNQLSQSQFTLIIKRFVLLSKEAKIVTTSAILLGSLYLVRRNKLKQQRAQSQVFLNTQNTGINND